MWGRSHPKYGPTGDRRQSIALVPEGSQNRTVKRDLIGELRAGRCGYASHGTTMWGRSHPKYGPTGDRRQSIALVPEGSQKDCEKGPYRRVAGWTLR
ncbi:hypothetical protein PRIPAC_86252, partial [Pristionchus pacificus]|uniref:Uncharacterized protein n=1 Tax=Pristionchus pacificus TaxID=54126 RepID=A0A2A6BMD9_PRIPA